VLVNFWVDGIYDRMDIWHSDEFKDELMSVGVIRMMNKIDIMIRVRNWIVMFE
jgi:hypothetical protein